MFYEVARNIAKHARNLKKAASMLKRDEWNFYQLACNFLSTCAQFVARNFWHLRVTYEKLRASLDMIKKELIPLMTQTATHTILPRYISIAIQLFSPSSGSTMQVWHIHQHDQAHWGPIK